MNYQRQKMTWFNFPLFTLGILFGVCGKFLSECYWVTVDGTDYINEKLRNRKGK